MQELQEALARTAAALAECERQLKEASATLADLRRSVEAFASACEQTQEPDPGGLY